MPSLMELVDRVNKGELIDSEQLEIYQESPNTAEKFLAHHAHAMLDLRRAHQHMLQSLEAIDYSDQKVLNQFVSISTFLGLTDLRAGPVIKFGSSAIARREYGLGLAAIQNGVAYDLQHNGAFTTDRQNCQFIGAQYERVAQALGWAPEGNIEWNNKQTRLALVVSGIADEEASGRFLHGLAKAYDSKRFKLHVYVTESGVRREKQQFAPSVTAAPTSKRGKETLELLAKSKVPTWIATTDGDSVSASTDLAAQLVKDRIDVALFDATQADPIASVISNWQVARVKINVVRKAPLYSNGIHCVTYFDQIGFDDDKSFWTGKQIDSKFILEGIETDIPLAPAPQRSAYGIPANAVVLATAGADLDRTLSEDFVETIINILRAHPHAIYLLAGDGELSWQKRKFESAGVGKRIGYAGKRRDLPGFLRIADLYLAEFPSSSASGVLQAMAMERPVVALRWSDDIEHSQAAAFVGSEGAIGVRDTGLFIERVSKLIREPQTRQKVGKNLRVRVEQHFGFNQTARHLEQLCDQMIQQQSDQTDAKPAEAENDAPVAKVA